MKYTINGNELQVQKNNGVETLLADNLKLIKLSSEKYTFVLKSGQEVAFWDKKDTVGSPENDFRKFATEHNISVEYQEKFAHAKPEETTQEIGVCYRNCKARYKEAIEEYVKTTLGASYEVVIEDDFEAYCAAMHVEIRRGEEVVTIPEAKNQRGMKRGKERVPYVPERVEIGELISYNSETGVALWYLYNDLDTLISYKMQDIDAIKA